MLFKHKVSGLFCLSTIMFLCHGACNDAIAGSVSNFSADVVSNHGNIQLNNPTVQERLRNSVLSTADAVTRLTLCNPGEYVAACGNYRVGFNWLKGATIPKLETLTDITYKKTRNYYFGNDTLALLNQMRVFFGHENTQILDSDGNTVSADDLQQDRETILNNICNPSNPSSKPLCARCPNDADVKASTVQLDADNLVVKGSWDFYTVADCYMQKFEDTTGAYFYIPDTADFDTSIKEKCYYTNTNPEAFDALSGDEIGTIVPGITTEISNEIPVNKIPSAIRYNR